LFRLLVPDKFFYFFEFNGNYTRFAAQRKTAFTVIVFKFTLLMATRRFLHQWKGKNSQKFAKKRAFFALPLRGRVFFVKITNI
jgi:hypothetical protein